MPDRGGGREVKGTVKNASKKNPGSKVAKAKKAAPAAAPLPSTKPFPPAPRAGAHFDCGAALLSRQFDRDRDRVLERAGADGQCSGVLVWFSDVDKQAALADLCAQHKGLLYLVAGVHPDNIDRTNKRSHEGWLKQVEELSLRPECLGLLSGVNLTRDVATHFAQESLLRSTLALCDRLKLPLVLHVAGDGASLDKALEVLAAEGWAAPADGVVTVDSRRSVVLHDALAACGGSAERVALAVRAGLVCAVSAAGISEEAPSEARDTARACVRAIPLPQLVVCSDSPWKTPQNLPDAYFRGQRNEPSNVPALVQAVADAIGAPDAEALARTLKTNALRVLGLTGAVVEAEHGLPLAISEAFQAAAQAAAAAHAAAPPVSPALPTSDQEDGDGDGNGDENAHEEEEEEQGEEEEEEEEEEQGEGESEGESEGDNGGDDTAGQPPKQQQHQERQAQPDAADSGSSSKAQVRYECHKCRATLFLQPAVLTHAFDAAKTVFKAGEEGLCSAAVFVLHRERDEVGFSVVAGKNVECNKCAAKLGRFSTDSVTCPCGAMVPGPAVRMTTSKVDRVDPSLELEHLLQQSRLEAELAAAEDDALDDDDEARKSKARRNKKQQVGASKANLSQYRNKDMNVKKVGSAAKKAAAAAGRAGAGAGAASAEEEDADEAPAR